jgi:naphthalene 1,2-dioxygenase ferredoxin component
MDNEQSQQWVDAMAADALPDDDVVGVAVDGRDIAIYTVAGDVYATDNICTHGQARLCDGFLDGHEIECPLHQGRFDVRSGQPLCDPVTEPVRSYPVKIDGARVYLRLA